MDDSSAANAIDLDRAEVRISLRCIECGYDIRGLKAGGNCPECGHAVLDTLLNAIEQSSSRNPVRSRSSRSGLALLLAVAWLTLGVMCYQLSVINGVIASTGLIGRFDLSLLTHWPPIVFWLLAALFGWLMLPERHHESRRKMIAVALLISIGVPMLIVSSTHFRMTVLLGTHIHLGLGPDWGIFYFVVFWAGGLTVAIIGIGLAMRTMEAISGQRFQSRHTRQGISAMIAAIAAAALGASLMHFGQSLFIIGEVMLRIGQLMLLIGMVYLTMNAWWIYKALSRPPLTLRQMLRVID